MLIVRKVNVTMEHADSEHIKIFFALEQDDDDSSPVSVESIWALRTQDGFYEIDNIPFYAKGVSYKDIVEAVPDDDGCLCFKCVVRPSQRSTIRVIVADLKDQDDLLKKLENFGCSWGGSNQSSLITVDVSPEVDLDSVIRFLQDGFEQDRWDYEEASIPD